MVLLDTEGIDAYDQTGQYSTQIFSLAVLLSSLFVYNQMGGIDEASLDRLSLVTEMTKHIRVRANQSNSGRGGDWELGEFAPSFIWLLRDFYLNLEEDGRAVTPRDYLETALRPVSGTGPSIEAKNQIRASIKALFPDRECFTLVRPVNDEKNLQQLEKIPSSQLRPEFLSGLQDLTRAIFQRAQPKRVGSMTLTGPLLAGLTKAYVDAINNGAVPCISTAWQGVAESECRRGAEEAEAEYVRVFNPNCGGEVEQLQAEHRRCLELAEAVYQDIAVGDEHIKLAHRERWVSSVETRFSNFRDKRLAEGALACEQMLNAAQNRLHQMRRAGTNFEQISEEFNNFMDAYSNSAEATGPTKWKRLQEFMQGSFRETVEEMGRRHEERLKEVEEQKRQEIASVKAQLAAAQQMNQNATELYQEQMQTMIQEKESEMRAAQSEMDAEVVRLRAEAAEQNSKLSRLQTQLNEKERQKIEAEHQLSATDQELQSLRRKLASSQDQIRELRERVDSAEQERLAALEAKALAEDAAARAQAAAREDAARAARSEAAANAARSTMNEAAGDFSRRLNQWEAPNPERSNWRSSASFAGHGESFHSPGEEVSAGLEQPNMGSPVVDPSRMTIKQIKEWLVMHGKEDNVIELSRSQTAKKADWIRLMQQYTSG